MATSTVGRDRSSPRRNPFSMEGVILFRNDGTGSFSATLVNSFDDPYGLRAQACSNIRPSTGTRIWCSDLLQG
jgi:hypothetical protein